MAVCSTWPLRRHPSFYDRVFSPADYPSTFPAVVPAQRVDIAEKLFAAAVGGDARPPRLDDS